MRIALSIDAGETWADEARFVLGHLLESLGFDTVGPDAADGPVVTVRYGGALGDRRPRDATVHIVPDTPAGPETYEPPGPPPPFDITVRADLVRDPADRRVVRLPFDPIPPCWFHLSRAEEARGESDSLGRFRPEASYLHRHGVLDRPVVDEFGLLLLRALETVASAAGIAGVRKGAWPGGRPFAVALTHDQDQSIRWIRRLARRVIEWARSAPRKRSATLDLFRRNLCEGPVDETVLSRTLFSLDRERGIDSTFFFLTVKRDRFGRRYDVTSPPFPRLIESLSSSGCSVALHASLEAFRSADRLRREKEKLESVMERAVSGVRHHYLNARFPATWKLHEEAGFLWDASLGYADHIGHRGGTSFPMRPPGTDRFLAFPLTVMDRAFVAAGASPNRPGRWIENVARVGGLIDILWHPYFIDPDEGEERLFEYRKLLESITSIPAGPWIATLDDMAAWWEERRAFRCEPALSRGGRTVLRCGGGKLRFPLALTSFPPRSDIRIESFRDCEADPGNGGDDTGVLIRPAADHAEAVISLKPGETKRAS